MPNQAGLIMKYFVLKPEGKTPYHVASRRAMRSYAAAIKDENPELAFKLREWADSEALQANMED
tara:strand:- start:124 stop:315 length:192 start_codon:yes stop_codon:yes gene_type:complete